MAQRVFENNLQHQERTMWANCFQRSAEYLNTVLYRQKKKPLNTKRDFFPVNGVQLYPYLTELPTWEAWPVGCRSPGLTSRTPSPQRGRFTLKLQWKYASYFYCLNLCPATSHIPLFLFLKSAIHLTLLFGVGRGKESILPSPSNIYFIQSLRHIKHYYFLFFCWINDGVVWLILWLFNTHFIIWYTFVSDVVSLSFIFSRGSNCRAYLQVPSIGDPACVRCSPFPDHLNMLLHVLHPLTVGTRSRCSGLWRAIHSGRGDPTHTQVILP